MPQDRLHLHPLFALCESAIGQAEASAQVRALFAALPGAPARSTLPRGDRHYLAWRDAGVQLIIGDGHLAQATFHLQPDAGCTVFAEPLLGDIASGASLSLAEALLGPPDTHDDGRDDDGVQRLPAWLRYRRGEVFLHVEAADGRTLSMIALVDS